MDDHEFVLAQLSNPGSRVLEVGCGTGQLAEAMAEKGHDVTAIDPDAPEGPIFRSVSLENFSEPGPFDAVVAGRSLHHIESLAAGLDKIHALLRPEGRLILSEFAWNRMDESTAAWYVSHAGPDHEIESLLPDNFPDAWIAEHEDLHTYEAMREELGRHFETTTFSWVPYISHYYLERDQLIAREQEAIDAGEVKPLGFRYVGRPKPSTPD